MARELMPQGIHVANVPIDAAIGWTQDDGTRAHRRAGTTVDDNMADPDYIAETYLQLHRQHRSTWVRSCYDHGSRSGDRPAPDTVNVQTLGIIRGSPMPSPVCIRAST
jgi:hypothetical protein